jgi:hypothetical protein
MQRMMCFKNDDDTIWARSLKDDSTHLDFTLCTHSGLQELQFGDNAAWGTVSFRLAVEAIQYHSSVTMRLNSPAARLSNN